MMRKYIAFARRINLQLMPSTKKDRRRERRNAQGDWSNRGGTQALRVDGRQDYSDIAATQRSIAVVKSDLFIRKMRPNRTKLASETKEAYQATRAALDH